MKNMLSIKEIIFNYLKKFPILIQDGTDVYKVSDVGVDKFFNVYSKLDKEEPISDEELFGYVSVGNAVLNILNVSSNLEKFEDDLIKIKNTVVMAQCFLGCSIQLGN